MIIFAKIWTFFPRTRSHVSYSLEIFFYRLESTSENATFGGLDDDCPSIPKEHGTPYPTWPRANGGVEPSGRGSGQGSGLGQPPLCVYVWLGEWGGCWGAWLRLP